MVRKRSLRNHLTTENGIAGPTVNRQTQMDRFGYKMRETCQAKEIKKAQKMAKDKDSAQQTTATIRRRTQCKHAAEEKIRMVLEGQHR